MMAAIISGQALFRNNPAQEFITPVSSLVIPCCRFFRLATAEATLKNRARISPAAQGLAELVAKKLRPTFFVPNQRANRLPGSRTRKKRFQSKPETPKQWLVRQRLWGVLWPRVAGQ
jgi:hypothetical protein